MSVPRGTTPTFILTFPEGTDFSEAQNVYVTFARYNSLLTKQGSDLEIEGNTVKVYLTQAETLKFSTGTIKIQANWTLPGGGRIASEVAQYAFSEQLLEKVIE